MFQWIKNINTWFTGVSWSYVTKDFMIHNFKNCIIIFKLRYVTAITCSLHSCTPPLQEVRETSTLANWLRWPSRETPVDRQSTSRVDSPCSPPQHSFTLCHCECSVFCVATLSCILSGVCFQHCIQCWDLSVLSFSEEQPFFFRLFHPSTTINGVQMVDDSFVPPPRPTLEKEPFSLELPCCCDVMSLSCCSPWLYAARKDRTTMLAGPHHWFGDCVGNYNSCNPAENTFGNLQISKRVFGIGDI